MKGLPFYNCEKLMNLLYYRSRGGDRGRAVLLFESGFFTVFVPEYGQLALYQALGGSRGVTLVRMDYLASAPHDMRIDGWSNDNTSAVHFVTNRGNLVLGIRGGGPLYEAFPPPAISDVIVVRGHVPEFAQMDQFTRDLWYEARSGVYGANGVFADHMKSLGLMKD